MEYLLRCERTDPTIPATAFTDPSIEDPVPPCQGEAGLGFVFPNTTGIHDIHLAATQAVGNIQGRVTDGVRLHVANVGFNPCRIIFRAHSFRRLSGMRTA